MKKLNIKKVLLADFFLLPLVYISGRVLELVRRVGIQKFPLCRKALLDIGVFPIRDHYFEPQFNFNEIKHSFSEDRNLPGINWNIPEQLKMLDKLSFSEELKNTPTEKKNNLEFYLNNDSFLSGDAEYWYQLIRLKKPKRIFEVGSGNSTLMAINAIKKNKAENSDYKCKHLCIEPFEAPWLEKTGVTVVRDKIESLDISFFSELESGDILFIDSSHVIKPEGDVLFEYLQLLPTLNNGVIVHIHDIFSPKNYPDIWLRENIWLWNEQYLLEAFLSHNSSWKIIGSLNYLHHNHYIELKKVCPFLTPNREPGSFYIQKTT